MSDTSSANGNGAAPAPPFVQVVKTADGCQVSTNLIDPFLSIALIEMAKQTLLNPPQPKVTPPPVGMAGLISRMRPH